MSVLGEDLRPVEPGSGQVGLLARRGHIPLGYYKDEGEDGGHVRHRPRRRALVGYGDHARIEADGTITPPGPRLGMHQHRRREGVPGGVEAAIKSHPDVFDVIVVGVPDARFTERVAAIVQPRTGRRDARGCRDPLPHDDRGLQGAARAQVVDAIQRTPSGKADYRWAKQQFETEQAAGS